MSALQELIGRDSVSGIETLIAFDEPELTSEVMEEAYVSIARYELESARA